MSVVGLDLSLNNTGYAFIDGAGNIDSGVLHPPRGMKGGKRLRWLADEIISVIEHYTNMEIGLIAIEGYSFASKFKSAELGEIGGAVKVELERAELPYVIVSPNQLKKFITGKGVGKKNVVLMHTLKTFGIEYEDDNECDAFVLAKIAESLCEGSVYGLKQTDSKLNKAQSEVLQKVKEGGDWIGKTS